jgi:hypothetical protein
MYDSVVNEETRKSIETISSLKFLGSFYLAGGTACAMHLGHRISHDLDFFSMEEFSLRRTSDTLKDSGHFIIDYSDSRTLIGRFNKTKVSFFHYSYPLIEDVHRAFGLTIASLVDIGCMKIDAISSRGSKRDFVDLYFILNSMSLGLSEMLRYFEKKYGGENFNIIHILKSLVYFTDADIEPELNMLATYSWEDIKTYFTEQIQLCTDKPQEV